MGNLVVSNDLNSLEIPAPIETLSADEKIDLAEAWILNHGGEIQDFGEDIYKLTHRFTPGLYIREIYMPAGSVLSTKIHKTEHPFVISAGKVSVYSGNDGPQYIEAPYTGITKPGTRRFLVVHEDTIWTTFHPNPDELRDIVELEKFLCVHRNNPLIAGFVKPLQVK